MPNSFPITQASIAAYFNGFFLPNFYYNGQIYVNTQLTIIAPYIAQRTIYEYTLWQANDPLVHYQVSDLNYYDPNLMGLHRSDDPINNPVPVPSQISLGKRYQPWGRNKQMLGLAQVNTNAYDLTFRDPLVWGSDNWNFPTNLTASLGGLGQVHRGTPWQTVYLKAYDVLHIADIGPIVGTGTNTWTAWTGDLDVNDAALMAPVNDWRLAGLVSSLLNTNDATQLFSVNDPNISDWLNVLSGLTVYSNSVAYPMFMPVFDTYVTASNSPQALVMANGIAQVRASQPNQIFNFIGDVLAASELTVYSPWLNNGNAIQLDYGITDAAYEAIPAQLLPLLRPDSIGTMSLTNGGWNLQFSGSDAFTYELQESTDLVNWHPVSTNQPVQGCFNVSPPPNSSARFYRSRLLP
jgi:hypothetical protein